MENSVHEENSTLPIYIEKTVSEQQLLQNLSQHFNTQFDSVNFQKDDLDYFVMFNVNEKGLLIDLIITWKIDGGKPLGSREAAHFIATTFKTNVVLNSLRIHTNLSIFYLMKMGVYLACKC